MRACIRSDKESTKYPKVYAFNTNFYEKLTDSDESKFRYELVHRWTKEGPSPPSLLPNHFLISFP
jgi:Ulp1 family protease